MLLVNSLTFSVNLSCFVEEIRLNFSTQLLLVVLCTWQLCLLEICLVAECLQMTCELWLAECTTSNEWGAMLRLFVFGNQSFFYSSDRIILWDV